MRGRTQTCIRRNRCIAQRHWQTRSNKQPEVTIRRGMRTKCPSHLAIYMYARDAELKQRNVKMLLALGLGDGLAIRNISVGKTTSDDTCGTTNAKPHECNTANTSCYKLRRKYRHENTNNQRHVLSNDTGQHEKDTGQHEKTLCTIRIPQAQRKRRYDRTRTHTNKPMRTTTRLPPGENETL